MKFRMSHQPPLPRPAITTQDLLRLKRYEKPEPEFWDGFEQRLHARMLQQAIYQAPRRRWPKIMLAVSVPAAGLAGLVLAGMWLFSVPSETPVWAQRETFSSETVPVEQTPVVEMARGSDTFEVDSFQNHPVRFVKDDFRLQEPQRFQKVMSSETYRVNQPNGAIYVVDNLAPFTKSSTVAAGMPGMTHF